MAISFEATCEFAEQIQYLLGEISIREAYCDGTLLGTMYDVSVLRGGSHVANSRVPAFV
jgi:hypothetical protein